MFTNFRVIDDFLKQEHFNFLINLKLDDIKKKEIKIYSNKYSEDQKCENSCLELDFIKEFHNTYHKQMMDLLINLYPEKSSLWDYSEFHIIETGADYKYPIHRDTPNKLLSGVVYLSPSVNKGTILYENKVGKNPKIIEWKTNRALFFSRTEKTSFHSYESDKISTRRTLVYNLMTTKLREVCKIEKINYQQIKMREFLNPYIHRFFGKVL